MIESIEVFDLFYEYVRTSHYQRKLVDVLNRATQNIMLLVPCQFYKLQQLLQKIGRRKQHQ